MRDSVRRAFVGFTAPLEGAVPWFYLDVKGLVTIAIGNLVDPIQYALPLPLVKPDGSFASREEIASEWLRVKGNANLAKQGYRAAEKVTTLRLAPEGLDLVVGRKLAQMDAHLAARFSEYQTWPADAQLALISMAWACGPAFRFPMFEAHIKAQKFDDAARECHLNETGNPGLKPRNIANKRLFHNAARVLADRLDPEVLYFPEALPIATVSLDTIAGVQSALERLGYDVGGVDGIAGAKTRAAILAFQMANPPLTADGVMGPKSKAALELALQRIK